MLRPLSNACRLMQRLQLDLVRGRLRVRPVCACDCVCARACVVDPYELPLLQYMHADATHTPFSHLLLSSASRWLMEVFSAPASSSRARAMATCTEGRAPQGCLVAHQGDRQAGVVHPPAIAMQMAAAYCKALPISLQVKGGKPAPRLTWLSSDLALQLLSLIHCMSLHA